MDIYEINQKIEELSEEILNDSDAQEIQAGDIGLDSRIGRIYISENFIAVSSKEKRKTIDYYGGFEYIDADDITTIGDVTFYSSDSSRVRDHIDRWLETKLDEDEEE